MSLILKPKVSYKEEGNNTGSFEILPLNKGYGYTLGNIFRRVLLSSIEGAAITSVRIEGAKHELSSLDGVKDDVLTIMLRLKKLVIKINGQTKKVNLYLEKSKRGKVYAGDFNISGDAEIINGDMEITEITGENKTLIIEAIAEKGFGYLPVEDRQNEVLPVDFFQVDAIFSPVLSVRYYVENTRVGQVTSLDKLILSIKTDGSISPRTAFENAIKILIESFTNIENSLSILAISFKHESSEEITYGSVEEKRSNKITMPTDKGNSINSKPIDELSLSQRTVNALKNNGVLLVDDILKLGPKGISQLKGVGEKAIAEVTERLKDFNINLKD